MEATMGNSAHAIPEHRLICRVCQKQYSKYTCPQCNLRYCSLACYKNHSLRCTESFMRNNVIEEMRDIQASKESQQNMLEALKRIRFDDDGRSIIEDEVMGDEDGEDDDSDGRHGTVFSERTLKLIAEGGDISLDDLSVDERKDFLRALAAGEISHLIQPWYPWWLNPRAGTTSITTHGTSLIQPVNSSEEENPKQIEALEAVPGEVPVPPSEALAPVRQLIRGDPSPLIPVQLAEVIYNYCFTLRFCNGDWQSDPLDAALILLSASQVLDQAASPESISMALADSVKTICSPTFRHAGGFKFAMALFDDCSAVLRLDRACVVCAQADLHRMLENAKTQLKAELGEHKQVKPRHEIRSMCGGSENDNLRSPGNEKQSMGSVAAQNPRSRGATEQNTDGMTYAELRLLRDRKRGMRGNKKQLSIENETPSTSSNVSPNARGDGAIGKSPKRKKTSMELKTITAAIRKTYFLMCWTNEQPSDAFLSLALLVDAEKERLLEIDPAKYTGLGIVQEVKAPVIRSGPTIEEIVEK
ncbi:unnamed protein product [Calypogeia fissa]